MNGMRHYYEARVLLVPQGGSAIDVAATMRDLGLDGVLTATEAAGGGFGLRPLGRHGWAASSRVDSATDAVAGADIVILLATDLAEVHGDVCAEIAETARRDGGLVAALVVGSIGQDTPGGDGAMAALRAAVDMLVVVRGPELAASFVDVLRGGRRDGVVAA
ncbi:hypothetical protein [Prauserella muralis]|uniref:hypothetical protein n=1 Tax=Prauserella muralis TaxID=588067 RepID=UPI0011ABECA6|nr:hypothetical protein [Prauserella muralis]TWE22326.1 hypothetical protein FHX69_3564 [Prauserella muralis]